MALCFLLPLYMASSSTQQVSPVPLLTTWWEFYPSLKIKFQSLFPQWLQPTVISTPFELCIVNRYSKYCSISTHQSLPLRTLFSRRKKRAKKYTQNKLFCLFFFTSFLFQASCFSILDLPAAKQISLALLRYSTVCSLFLWLQFGRGEKTRSKMLLDIASPPGV